MPFDFLPLEETLRLIQDGVPTSGALSADCQIVPVAVDVSGDSAVTIVLAAHGGRPPLGS